MPARKTIDADDGIRRVRMTTIINDELGYPDIYGHPYTINEDAVHQTTYHASPVVTDELAGRLLAWVVEVAEWDDDE